MKKKTIVMICVIAFAVICAGIVFFPVLRTEKVEEAGRLHYSVSFTEDRKTGQYSDFYIVLYSTFGRKKISNASYTVDPDGTVSLSVTERGIPLFFPKNDDGYHIAIPGVLDEDTANAAPGIRRIVLNTEKENVVIWEDGETIDLWTSHLFNKMTENVANAQSLAETILVMLNADRLTLEDPQEGLPFLVTFPADRREITVDYNPEIVAFESQKDLLQEWKMDSCYLLALLDGLEKVNWQYSFAGKRDAFSFSAAQASEELGQDVKSYGKTAGALQKLTDLRSTYPPVYFD